MSAQEKDSGFGWLIVFASFMCHFFQYGVVWTVGVFYVIFLEHIGGSNGAVALISSLNTAVFYFTGPLAGTLTNMFGERQVAFVGAVIGCVGLGLSSFASSLIHLYLTFGVITGFGLGLSYIPTVAIVGHYFERKRSLALGFAVSGIGAGTFTFPPVIRYLCEEFGWRGCILILAGICLNICVCAAAYRPFRVKKGAQDTKDTKFSSPKITEQKLSKDKPKWNLLLKTKKALNLQIFQNSSYIFLCLNNVLNTFGLAVVYVHLASYALSLGFSETEGAMLFSSMGISNFAGRVFFGLLGNLSCFTPITIYISGFFLSGVVIGLTPYAQSYIALQLCASCFGFLSGTFGTQLPQVVIQILDVSQLTTGYGYLLTFEALGTLMGGPVAGWVYDQWHYYPASLYLGALFLFMSCFVMLIPWYTLRRDRYKCVPPVFELDEIKVNQPLVDSIEPLTDLKKQVFLSMESLHSFVEDRMSTAAA